MLKNTTLISKMRQSISAVQWQIIATTSPPLLQFLEHWSALYMEIVSGLWCTFVCPCHVLSTESAELHWITKQTCPTNSMQHYMFDDRQKASSMGWTTDASVDILEIYNEQFSRVLWFQISCVSKLRCVGSSSRFDDWTQETIQFTLVAFN